MGGRVFWRASKLLFVHCLFILGSSGEFDYYNDYPLYDVECKGGELEENSLVFDGTSSVVENDNPRPELTEFTACWWMKSDAADNTGVIFNMYVSDSDFIQFENPSNLRLSVNGEDGLESGLEANYGEWIHVCVTWKNFEDQDNQGVYEIYKDGVRLLDEEGLAVNGTLSSGSGFTIGQANSNLGGTNYEGEITKFNIWTRKLEDDAILALSEDRYNPGCGDFFHWNQLERNDLTGVSLSTPDLPPNPNYVGYCNQEGVRNQAFVFDGDQNHVTFDRKLSEVPEFTACFWIKVPVGASPDQTIFSYFAKGDTTGSIVLENPSDLKLTVANQEEKSSKVNIQDGNWHHVCVAWDFSNGRHYYYLDGQETSRRKLAKGVVVHSGGQFVIGQKQTAGGSFEPNSGLSAEIWNFNMWSERLDASEIRRLRNDMCNRTCGDVIWWPYFFTLESPLIDVSINEFEELDQMHCPEEDFCRPGVFDDNLWVVDNSGDWSLSPMPKDIPDLSEFTICVWISLDDLYANLTNTVYSYFVPGDTEGSIVLENVNDLTVIINNQRSEPTGINLNNGTSHMVCVTWDSFFGDFAIFVKKEELYRGTGLAAGELIQGGGSLILGQKQSTVGGGYNKEDAFYGKMRYFNFFNKVLSTRGIRRASKTCVPDCGNVVSWHELEYVDLINIVDRTFTCGGSEDVWTPPPSTLPPTTVKRTTAEAPTTVKPTTAKPTTEEPPTTAKPTTEEPPTTAKPTTEEPPTTAKPTTEEPPTTAKPTTEEPPTTAKPTTEEPPTTAIPTTEEPPTTAIPTTQEPPTTAIPTTEEPPTTAKPTTEEPPTTAKPTTEEPPTTAKPTTEEPVPPTTPVEPTPSAPKTIPPTTAEKSTQAPPTTNLPTTEEVVEVLITKAPPVPTVAPTTAAAVPPPPSCMPEEPKHDCPCPDIETSISDQHARIPPCNSNIARGKRTEQSSSYWYTQSSDAVDGSSDSTFCHGSCTVTQVEYEPWFRVDLGKVREIYYVSLTTADDCIDSDPLLGAEVRVGSFIDFKKNRMCGVVGKDASRYPTVDIECIHGPVTGRYITVQIRCRETRLYLCELEAWTDDVDVELDVDVQGGHLCNPKPRPIGVAAGLQGKEGMLAQFQQFVFNMCCSSE
ncbi:uncharacterized protein [Ptychodera flava]|uniref:uncharacterized protein n=1 Tax=Ptychodera flava TaxID=63121 RepID=UPI003969CF8B